MNRTNIEYLDYTWNVTSGCSPISPGCHNCYARRIATNRLRGRCGYDQDDPFKPTFHPERLTEPLKVRKPSRIGVSFMGDLFHERIAARDIAEVFDVMACATLDCAKNHREHEEECWTGEPHTFLILTKRPERMRRFFEEELPHEMEYWPGDRPLSIAMEVSWPLPNVWLGVTAENQAMADLRIPILLSIPAARRWVSIEPCLEYINLRRIKIKPVPPGEPFAFLDWVALGGETGPGARLMNPEWARSVRDQCTEAGVPYFFKQMGRFWGATPPDLMVREMPKC